MTLIEKLLQLYLGGSAGIPRHVLAVARLSLFDWVVCGMGGLDEPVSRRIRDYVAGEYATGRCAVFGCIQSGAAGAALANGAISHALDYDDTHFAHIGHLSVGIFPAAMAAAEDTDSSLQELLEAFVLGAEAAIKVGKVLGPKHYDHGYHQTATAGAFGATVAAAYLYQLSAIELRAALGLCSTRASGLKNQFGTMGKPLNAGYAASNGVECAKLAKLGVTSAEDGLEGPQGFIQTHSDEPATEAVFDNFLFDEISFKLHACCHGTHAMIEAILKAKRQTVFTLKDVASLEVRTHPKWLRVCDIKKPSTGLEAKFSYSWLAGMTVQGLSTANPESYSDNICTNMGLHDFADKVTVVADNIPDTAAKIVFTLNNGTECAADYDLSDKLDENDLSARLRDKAKAVIGESSSELWAKIQQDGNLSARSLKLF